MNLDELQLIMGLLRALERKTKTDGLYQPLIKGIRIIEREIKLQNIDPVTGHEKTTLSNHAKDFGI